jgi:hypothetical protein
MDPVWEALEASERAEYVHKLEPTTGDLVLVAADRDYLLGKRWNLPLVMMEHGCGLQWYQSYIVDRTAGARAIAAPNEFVAQRYRSALPHQRVEVVGTPKMDKLVHQPAPNGRTVAVSFHWSGVNQHRSTLLAYRRALEDLAEQVEVIGHGHPRSWKQVELFYREIGIQPVQDFAEVIERADVYACDHSSTIYEWAALDRAVVLLQRTDEGEAVPIRSGLRYTIHADVGAEATPNTLSDTVQAALYGDQDHAPQRHAATAALFPHIGQATDRLVELLRDVGRE